MKQEEKYTQLKELLKDVKAVRVEGKTITWKEHWGKSGVFGKYLVSKADNLPFSVAIKKFPKNEEIVKEDGYVVHAHPTLEICVVIKGRFKVYFEDAGVLEFTQGDLLVQPPGRKHAAVSSEEDTEVVSINIPPADWEEPAE